LIGPALPPSVAHKAVAIQSQTPPGAKPPITGPAANPARPGGAADGTAESADWPAVARCARSAIACANRDTWHIACALDQARPTRTRIERRSRAFNRSRAFDDHSVDDDVPDDRSIARYLSQARADGTGSEGHACSFHRNGAIDHAAIHGHARRAAEYPETEHSEASAGRQAAEHGTSAACSREDTAASEAGSGGANCTARSAAFCQSAARSCD
jgi:hypothetical protein